MKLNSTILQKEKKLTGDEYERFNDKQFEAFKLTDEYRTLKAELMKDGSEESFVEEFVKIYVIAYSKRLVE